LGKAADSVLIKIMEQADENGKKKLDLGGAPQNCELGCQNAGKPQQRTQEE